MGKGNSQNICTTYYKFEKKIVKNLKIKGNAGS